MKVLQIFRIAASTVTLMLLAGFISANVRQLAGAKHWDNILLRAWDYCASLVPTALTVTWREKWWFWLLFGLSAGCAVALWAVSLLNPALEQSRFYHLDDVKRWRFVKQWIDTAVDDKSSKLQCSALLGIQGQSQTALDLYSEFYPLIYYSGWQASQGVGVEQNQPFGITILVGGKNRNAFLCGSKLSKMLQNLSTAVPVVFRDNQVTDYLIRCKYECVQIEIGGSV